MTEREALIRYLTQLHESGETELFLEELDAGSVYELLRSPAGVSASGTGEISADAVEASTRQGRTTGSRGGLLEALKTHAPEVAEEMGLRSEPPAPPAELAYERTVVAPPQPGEVAGVTLPVLAEQAADCRACPLHEGRQNVVFGEGNPEAEVVIVGEAPGAEEDRTGRPFVGPAGKLLDLLLMSVGLQRDQVYICNILKCRPPNNRDPQPAEIEACGAHLRRQLEVIGPRVLLAAGRVAAQRLVGREERIGHLRGEVHEYEGTPLIATYHPAYLLRSPYQVRAAWEDLQLLRKTLDEARTG